MKTGILFIFFILILLYFIIMGGVLYLSYRYIKYINDLEKNNCKCSEDIKRDMIKNFSYLILFSWALFILAILITPSKTILNIMSSKILNFLQFIVIAGYGAVLFLYSKKLIDESCACSESWLREAMQYQSYVYIFFSITSFLVVITKLLVGNDYRELIKIQKVLTNRK